MAEQDGNNLQHAEQLLREGRKQEAWTVLVGCVRSNPSSTRGWWMLSFALTDPKQQIECVERVLRLDPNYAPARARLEKLKSDIAPQLVSSSFKRSSSNQEVSYPSPSVSSVPKADSTSQPVRSRKHAPTKKKMNWVLPVAVLLVFLGAATAITIGFVVVLKDWQQSPHLVELQSPSATSTVIREQTLPPTWTPAIIDSTPTPTLPPASAATAILPSETVVPYMGTVVPPSEDGFAVGTSAPDFTFENVLTGKKENLSDYLGHPVIIFFLVSNHECHACNAEAPELQKIFAKHQNDGLVVLGVFLDDSLLGKSASRRQVRAYGETYGLTYPLLNDWERISIKSYALDGVPVNYFVDKNGVIASYNRGSMNYSELNIRVRIMLELIPTSVP